MPASAPRPTPTPDAPDLSARPQGVSQGVSQGLAQGSPAVLVTVALAGMLAGAMLAGSALGVVEANHAAPAVTATAAHGVTEANPETVGDGVLDDLEEHAPDAGSAAAAASATAAAAVPPDALAGALSAVIAAAPSAAPPRPPSTGTARPTGRLVTSDNVAAGPVQGYVEGRAVRIVVTRIDDKPVEVRTAAAYRRMYEAARRDRVLLRIVSGFRTMEHQEALYRAYRRGRGNLAAIPGHSNHQSGHAVDLNTSAPGVLRWLNRNAARYGFRRTVPTEPWHWEWW